MGKPVYVGPVVIFTSPFVPCCEQTKDGRKSVEKVKYDPRRLNLKTLALIFQETVHCATLSLGVRTEINKKVFYYFVPSQDEEAEGFQSLSEVDQAQLLSIFEEHDEDIKTLIEFFEDEATYDMGVIWDVE